jgi:homoserine O-acetyltransferase
MISLQWSVLYPEKVARLISVSSCYKAYPVSIATHQVQREIITLDPEWKEGNYETSAILGFKIARKFGLLSYRNPNELNERFRNDNGLVRYLAYNAEKFTATFDLNSYLYIFDAMDRFDVTAPYQDKVEPFRRIRAKTLVVSVSSDLLFPPLQQQELFQKLQEGSVDVTLIAHDSDYGHDAFYADKTIIQHIQGFLR